MNNLFNDFMAEFVKIFGEVETGDDIITREYATQEDFNEWAQCDIDSIMEAIDAPNSVIRDIYECLYDLCEITYKHGDKDKAERIDSAIQNMLFVLCECGHCDFDLNEMMLMIDSVCYMGFNPVGALKRPCEWR